MSALARVQGDFQDYLLRGRARHRDARRRHRARAGGDAPGHLRRRLPQPPGRGARQQLPGAGAAARRGGFRQRSPPATCNPTTRRTSPSATTASDLPQFLATHADYAAVPVLAELARWEWAMADAFDAADAAPLTHDSARAASLPRQWAQLRFRWHPSVRRLDLSWNVPQLWQALSDDERAARGGPELPRRSPGCCGASSSRPTSARCRRTRPRCSTLRCAAGPSASCASRCAPSSVRPRRRRAAAELLARLGRGRTDRRRRLRRPRGGGGVRCTGVQSRALSPEVAHVAAGATATCCR